MMAHFMPPGRVHDSLSLAASRGTVDAEETTLVARNKKSARMTEFTYGGDGVFLSNNLVQKLLWGLCRNDWTGLTDLTDLPQRIMVLP
jgi:hypothetical protein